MEILLKKKCFCGYGATTAEYKAFFEKFGGQWVPVETDYLFTDQYNVSDGNGGGFRVMDCDVSAVRDDVRRGLGKCRYCGAIVRAGEENAHFEAEEKKACVLDDSGAIVRACNRCFWLHSRRVNEKTETEEKTLLNGREVIKRVTWEREEKYCSYTKTEDLRGFARPCNKYGCRAYGVEWFTEKNTFFLKYPDGFNVPRLLVPREKISIGSYTLERGDRWSAENLYYVIGNFRRRVCFVWDETAENWRRLGGIGYNSNCVFSDLPDKVRVELRRVLLVRAEVWRAINAGFSDAAKIRLTFNDLGGACLEIFRKFETEKADFLKLAKTEEKQKALFCEWCAGLPSSFRPAFETFRQRAALRKFGGRPVSEENAAAAYYSRIAAEVWQICAAARLAVEK